MPPRLPLGAHRTLSLLSAGIRARLQHRCASTSPTPEIYDVVCVGGGPAGLSLLTSLRASSITSGLRVALIEGQDLEKNRLQRGATLQSFSNRCSSLTPASVRNLRGVNNFLLFIPSANAYFEKSEHGLMPTPHASSPTTKCKCGMA